VVRWVRGLQAIAQSGLAYARDPYDAKRYEQIRKIAAEIADSSSVAATNRIDTLFSEEFGYATPKLHTRAVASSGANTWAAP
jgi:Hydrolase of X-linked nucleoside diphosphate N terminal